MMRRAVAGGLALALWLVPPLAARAESATDSPVRLGTTFSPRQTEYLGLDWQETYAVVLDAGFDLIRLGTYWSDIEREPGVWDFHTVDLQLAEARRRGIPVIMTVGMKAPRWPEYFIPDWVLKDRPIRTGAEVSEHTFLKERTLVFMARVIERYRDEPAIRYWQVENEALDRAGPKFWWMDGRFLAAEVGLVRQLDDHDRPIVLTAATYPNRFLRVLTDVFSKNDPIPENLALCDILGLNAYPMIGHKMWWLHVYFRSADRRRVRYFKRILGRVQRAGKEAWITELQAEPWEPGRLVDLRASQPPTARPGIVRRSVEEFYEMGFRTVLLWGAEYWEYRKLHHDDSHWWDMVAEVYDRLRPEPRPDAPDAADKAEQSNAAAGEGLKPGGAP